MLGLGCVIHYIGSSRTCTVRLDEVLLEDMLL